MSQTFFFQALPSKNGLGDDASRHKDIQGATSGSDGGQTASSKVKVKFELEINLLNLILSLQIVSNRRALKCFFRMYVEMTRLLKNIITWVLKKLNKFLC